MGFKEITSLDADTIVGLGKKDKKTGKMGPKQAEGYYLGSRKVQSKRGESTIHFLQTSEGNLGLWGTTDMNRKLGQTTLGNMVRITSTGTKPTPNGDMYTYKVEVDPENTIEVQNMQETYNYSEAVESIDTEGPGDVEVESEDNDQVAALAAAERQARVQALLNKNKASGKGVTYK